MDTSICIARGMTRGRKGHGPQGAIGDTDSRSTSGPDLVAVDIWIVTVSLHLISSGWFGGRGITFWSKIIILRKVVEQDIFIINDVAARCFREVTLSTNGSKGDETKPLERVKGEPHNILERDG